MQPDLDRPLAEIAAAHVDWAARHLAKSTHRGYAGVEAAFLDWLRQLLGREPVVRDLTAATIDLYLSADRPDAFPTLGTRRTYGSSLRAFVNWAIECDLVPRDVLASFRLPGAAQTNRGGLDLVPRNLEADELDALFGHVERHRTRTFVRTAAAMQIALDCGARASEIVGLRVCDLDRAHGTLRIDGKGAKARLVPVGETTWAWLDAWLRVRGAPLRHPEEAIFIGRVGRPRGLCPDTLEHGFADLVEAAGLQGKHRRPSTDEPVPYLRMINRDGRSAQQVTGISFHDLRRTFCTLFAEGGGTVEEMAAILGESEYSIPMLLRVYYRPSLRQLQAAHGQARPGDAYQEGRAHRQRVLRRAA